jgi:hypothetical protein
MLKNLVKIASDLDAAGFKKEADIVDLIIRKVASSVDESDGLDLTEVPTSVASDEELKKLKELEELLRSKVSPEEAKMYEEVQQRVLEEEEEEEPSDEDFEGWLASQSG